MRDWMQRLLWGRTRRESERRARLEAREREYREALRNGECFVVHAPDIWAGWCEVHQEPVYGSSCRTTPTRTKRGLSDGQGLSNVGHVNEQVNPQVTFR